jgi:hypothetical protein
MGTAAGSAVQVWSSSLCIFVQLLLLPPSMAQTFSSATCSWTLSISDLFYGQRSPVQKKRSCTWEQSMRFAYVTSLLVEGKQTYILCKPKTLPTQEMRWRATKYCHWDLFCLKNGQKMLPYLLSLPPLWSPCNLFLTDVERTDSPRL